MARSADLTHPNWVSGSNACKVCLAPTQDGFCSYACMHANSLSRDPKKLRKMVYARDLGVCSGCGANCKNGSGNKWEADHIVPVIDGGLNTIDNIRTLCKACHSAATKTLNKRLADDYRGKKNDITSGWAVGNHVRLQVRQGPEFVGLITGVNRSHIVVKMKHPLEGITTVKFRRSDGVCEALGASILPGSLFDGHIRRGVHRSVNSNEAV